MPVKKNPNRYMFLLLCFGLLFLSGLAFYNVETPDQLIIENGLVTPLAERSESNNNTQINDEDTRGNDLSGTALISQNETATQTNIQIQNTTVNNNSSSAVNSSVAIKAAITKNEKVALAVTNNKVDIVSKSIIKPTISHSAEAVKSNPQINVPTLILNKRNRTKVEDIALLDNIDRLPIIGLTVADRNKKQLSAPISAHIIKHRKSIDASIALGGMMSTDYNFHGYGGMLKLDYNLSRKLALSTGIGLYQLSQKEVSETLANAPLAPPGPATADISRTHYGNTAQLTDLIAPISLKYKLTRKASIYGGIMMRWNMEKHVKNNSSRITFPITSEDVIYNEYFINPIVGLDFEINRKISFGLQYEKGLRSLINTDYFSAEDNKLSFLNLNIAYTF